MKGIELSRKYFEEFGRPMLENDFREILPFLAVGVTGRGSENFGFDDEISEDHDFEPGFCIFLPDEKLVDRKTEFLLERAYAKLPKSYNGYERQKSTPVGGFRHGVLRTAEYFTKLVGFPDGKLSDYAWLHIPDFALSEAVNGEIFFDNYGEVTEIRENLKNMPKFAKIKRIAGNLLVMAQAGQYNFKRAIDHGEPEAASFALREFTVSAMKALFLINGRYLPYYKWYFRALRELEKEIGSTEFSEKLSFLMLSEHKTTKQITEKETAIDEIAGIIIKTYEKIAVRGPKTNDLEKHAYYLNDLISDAEIRNINLFECT